MRSVIPVAQMEGEDEEDTGLLRTAFEEAAAYIQGFNWCKGVREAYFGVGFGGVVAVFLVRIVPTGNNDEWLWVITGDLPSAYLVTDEAPTPAAALSVYCGLMEDWISSVRTGSPLDDVFPVNIPPTSHDADGLATRIEILRKEIISTLSL
jgi:hypothetical protein